MNNDLQLKVQAWLDGELPDDEARRIGEWVANDAEASGLAAELGCLKQAMSGNEVAASLGESREFYWSKIERQIQREAALANPRPTPWYARWRRYLAPAMGVAAFACLAVMAVKQAATPTFDEISSTTDSMEAVTFHDQSSQMTVVWLQDNSPSPVQEKSAKAPVPSQDAPESVIDM
jgi:anti-sigma factor RsiW